MRYFKRAQNMQKPLLFLSLSDSFIVWPVTQQTPPFPSPRGGLSFPKWKSLSTPFAIVDTPAKASDRTASTLRKEKQLLLGSGPVLMGPLT